MSDHETSMIEPSALQDLLATFSGNSDLKDLDPKAPLQGVLDSLAHFSFLVAVEKAFGLALPDESFTLHEMGTLDGILATIRSHQAT